MTPWILGVDPGVVLLYDPRCNISEPETTEKHDPPPRVSFTGVAARGRGECIEVIMPAPKKPRIVDGVTEWRCGRCREWKQESEYNSRTMARNGLRSECRDCQSADGVDWHGRNKESVSARKKADREANPEKHAARVAAWGKMNPEKRRAAVRRWRGRNTEHGSEYGRRYAMQNPLKIQAKNAVGQKLRSGLMTRPINCEVCGNDREPLQAHHDSYDPDRHLVVTWMCPRCHGWTHAERARAAS